MPKVGGKKSQAAKVREAAKRGEKILSAPPIPQDPSVLTDPTYVPDLPENVPMSDVEEATSSSTRKSRDDIAGKRKWQQENADILPERPTTIARTTAWRNSQGKTKKARAKNMQLSIASLFKSIPAKFKRQKQEEEESLSEDSDIQIVEQNGTQTTNQEEICGELVHNDESTRGSDSETRFDSLELDSTPIPVSTEPLVVSVPSPLEALLESPVSNSVPTTQTIVPESSCIPATELESAADLLQTQGQVPSLEREQEKGINARDFHCRVKKLITTKQKEYRKKPKTIVSNTNAANILIFLESLSQYNDLRLKKALEKQDLEKTLKHATWRVKPRIWLRISRIRPSLDASNAIANRVGKGSYFSRKLRSSAMELWKTGQLPENKMGKGAHHDTPLNIPGVSSALQSWVKGTLPFEEGGFVGNMRPAKLKRYVNDFLFPKLEIENKISEPMAVRWLKKLGFKLSRVQKGVYVDGHERNDVVISRTEFINYMFTHVLPFAYAYEGEELVEISPANLPPGQKIHYPIFHDETCIHANDLDNYVWMREGEQPLRNKSRGRIVHVSDFIIEHCGRLCLSAAEIEEQMKLPLRPSPPPSMTTPDSENVQNEDNTGTTSAATSEKGKGRGKKDPKTKNTRKTTGTQGRTFTEQEKEWVPPPPPAPFTSYQVSSFDARRIIYPGANYDPWWDMPQLIAQTKVAIEIFEAKYPDGIAVFIFDCSSAHEAYPADALLAHKMNRGPGGKQPFMRDTIIPSTGERQAMVYPADCTKCDKDGKSLAGKQKGMEQVLLERNLLAPLQRKHGSKLVAVCAECKKTEAAREAAIKLAKSKQDEAEGLGEASLNIRGISDLDSDVHRAHDCCMQRVLSLQPDFRDEKPLLQLVVEKAGHKCLFLPKFHCELNPIEMVWGQTKQRFREYADGTFATAKKLVPECLDNVTTANIRRYFRHCYRYMDAYRLGLNIKQAAYAVKKYTSHRRVPANVFMDVNIITRGATG